VKKSKANNRFGLPEKALAGIKRIFSDYPDIEKVVLYGSRAKGDYREGSDIDLTIVGDRLTAEQFSHLQVALDDLLLPYTIDLSLLRQIENPDLLAHIARVGVVFYERQRPSSPASRMTASTR